MLNTRAISSPTHFWPGLRFEASKYSEIKGLVGGTTTIEGGIDSNGVSNILLRNAEHTNFGQDRVIRTVADINDPSFTAVEGQVIAADQAGNLDAFLLHLAEGTDAASLAEFDKLKQRNLLDEWDGHRPTAFPLRARTSTRWRPRAPTSFGLRLRTSSSTVKRRGWTKRWTPAST